MELNEALRIVRSVINNTTNATITLDADGDQNIRKITIPLDNADIEFLDGVRNALKRKEVKSWFEDGSIFVMDIPTKEEVDS